jgi:hypothetical protein
LPSEITTIIAEVAETAKSKRATAADESAARRNDNDS